MSSRIPAFARLASGQPVAANAEQKLIEINVLAAFLLPSYFSAFVKFAVRLSRRLEAQHALLLLGREASLDQHVIDMRDQFAGGKAHLMGVERVLVEHHRHQLLGGLRNLTD